MMLPISIAEKLIAMQNGEEIPYSQCKHPVIEAMIENGILRKQMQGRSKAKIILVNQHSLIAYHKNHFGIDSLENYVSGYKKENVSRAEAIEISSDSKLKSIRTFTGFLVNCFQPVACLLNDKAIIIQPQEGTFTFVYDYQNFIPAADITIVGIENPDNFRHIQKQKELFKNLNPLFISRYPQSKDGIKWLQAIPNPYLHFGDFDFAGINIYWNEYKKYLQDKAEFFLPENIENLLSVKGNRDNYHNQALQFNLRDNKEPNITRLIQLIEKYKKGLEQEIFIRLPATDTN